VVVLVITTASPASADPARPTNYQSEVEGIEPPSEGVRAQVLGGDAFLELSVDEGVGVEVPGYEGEPYIRIDPDGTVSVNQNSPAYWLNNDRYARLAIPPDVSADSPPLWDVVAADGTWGWHDHRIHWMAPDLPPTTDLDERAQVFAWSVPIQVDGETVSINGRLEWLPSISPLPWVGVMLFSFVLLLVASRYRLGALLGTLFGSAVASAVGIIQAVKSPLGFGGELLAWAPPLAALCLVLVALLRPNARRLLLVVAVMLVGVWISQRISSFRMPNLPTELPESVERSLIAVTAGSVAAGLVWFGRMLGQSPPAPG
jgi:hypothetical protein